MKCKLFITDVYLNSCLLLQTNDDNVIDRGVLKYLSSNVGSTECKKRKMRLLKITGFLLILNSHICQSKAGESPFEHGKKLPVVPFMVLDNFGMQMCLKECEAISLCYSINFYRKLLKCELNSVGQNESLSLITDQDYVYSEILHPVCIVFTHNRVTTSLFSFSAFFFLIPNYFGRFFLKML